MKILSRPSSFGRLKFGKLGIKFHVCNHINISPLGKKKIDYKGNFLKKKDHISIM